MSGRAGAASPAAGGTGAARLVRFDGVQRAAHWSVAVLVGICMVTAVPLYVGAVGAAVGRRGLIESVHVWAGLALPVPLLVSVAGPWGRRMRRDLRRCNRWTHDELRWLRRVGGRDAPPVSDKFNPGQKLSALLFGSGLLVMLGTGAMMKWFGHIPVAWRTGATFVHDVGAAAVALLVVGHVVFALTHPAALRSMVRGWVEDRWARVHAPGWWAEEHGHTPEPPGSAPELSGSAAAGPGPTMAP